jgi:hypothetical protein
MANPVSIYDAVEELKAIRKVALHNWSCDPLSEESSDRAWLSIAAGCESVARSLGVDIRTPKPKSSARTK